VLLVKSGSPTEKTLNEGIDRVHLLTSKDIEDEDENDWGASS
jgi:hypothetical protein